MFDSHAQGLFEFLPQLEGLQPEEARRMLSRSYLGIVELRTNHQGASPDLLKAVSYLRRLASTLEMQAVFRVHVDSEHRKASAFIAAEALALAAEFQERLRGRVYEPVRLLNGDLFHRLEAALLYLVAQYDSNAAGILADVPGKAQVTETVDITAEWLFDRLCDFCRSNLRSLPEETPPVELTDPSSLSPQELERDTLARLYMLIGTSVINSMQWLAGTNDNGLEHAQKNLNGVLSALSPETGNDGVLFAGHGYSRVHHLSKLLIYAMAEISRRALLHVMPVPTRMEYRIYREYLVSRARGSVGGAPRPVLWPSADAYVQQCLQRNIRHAVISMPTGSGKSFVAELAVSQHLALGWCLYLVPTNALAQQVRSDLRRAYKPLQTGVLAFIGDGEYTTLETETVSGVKPNSVVVMTPEKCLLALRLKPDAFKNCSMVVFDECQLIGEASSGRGATAELVLSQLMLLAPEARFLLMSAIIQNPDHLAAWLQHATGQAAVSIPVGWRPTRTLRGALAVDAHSAMQEYEKALESFDSLPASRKWVKFDADYALVAGLQGAWRSAAGADYSTVLLPIRAHLKVRRPTPSSPRPRVSADSWVNGSTGEISVFLGNNGIQTLAFIPSNKHYPFSIANKVALGAECASGLGKATELIGLCKVLSEYEYGLPSLVFSLLDRGIAVHTASMLDLEKTAAEEAFRRGSARIMFATGTLAQGLNLPAIAVVIAGTRIGDPRGQDAEVIEQRKLSQLLNAAGRAGRAGFSNQGIVIAVPDEPLEVASQSPVEPLRERVSYLKEEDNAVQVVSTLDHFLDVLGEGQLSIAEADALEVHSISVLGGGDPSAPAPSAILSKSYAAYLRKRAGLDDVADAAGANLTAIRNNFLRETDAPEWMTIAAQRSGLDFWTTLALSRSWAEIQPELPADILKWTVGQWRDLLLRILARMPARLTVPEFGVDAIKRIGHAFEDLLGADPGLTVDNREWRQPDGWEEAWLDLNRLLIPWMDGKPLAELASLLTDIPVEEITPDRTAGKPIPSVLALINDSFDVFARFAGGLVAVAEQLFATFSTDKDTELPAGVPRTLSNLPLCLKHGFSNPESLAWFRFGLRLRRPAHLLSSIFPVPSGLSDSQVREWVVHRRRQWLLEPGIPVGAYVGAYRESAAILEAARAFLASRDR